MSARSSWITHHHLKTGSLVISLLISCDKLRFEGDRPLRPKDALLDHETVTYILSLIIPRPRATSKNIPYSTCRVEWYRLIDSK